MIKSLSFLIAGAMVGAAIVRVTVSAGDDASASEQGSRSFLQSVADLAFGGSRTDQVLSVSEALEIYRAAAAESDVAALRTALRRQARAPSSPARIAKIDATLARLSDLAPAEAVALARSLRLDSVFIADAYLNLARVDPDRAVSELSLIEGRSARHDVAMTLLAVFGDSAHGIDRVSAGLPESERGAFRVEWISFRAAHEPFVAIQDAQSLSRDAQRHEALERIGRSLAAQDPRGALTRAVQLPSALQDTFRTAVFDEWAGLDAADFLAWLSTTTSPPSEYPLGVRAIAAIEPDLVLSIADDLPEAAGRMMKEDAFSVLAERDADAAMARVNAMPPGADRESMLATVVSSIARRDPDRALEWARELGSPSQELMRRVVLSIARADPNRAIEFIDSPPEGVDPLIASSVTAVLAGNPTYAESVANRLLASDSIRATGVLRSNLRTWIHQDPERALDWVFANEARLGGAVIGSAAQAIAATDPAAAANYVDRVSADNRSVWISQVAAYYGAADVSAALSWADQFQGDEVYPSAMRQIISAAAQTDPRSAAQSLVQSSPEVQLGAAMQVAQAYARVDPREAIRWARTLGDVSAREEAASAAISTWAAIDQSAVRNYAMNLDQGEERDQALSALLPRVSQSGGVDRSFFDAYSSDTARQQALAVAIPLIAQNDPNQAEELLDLVTGENARRQLEERLHALTQ